jgi:gentisate 1,2-dioxygenase
MNTRDIEMQRAEYYQRIAPHSLAPLWTRLKGLVPAEPTPVGVAHRWRYADVRPHVMESARLISAEEAERRVLILENPAMQGSSQVTNTLYAGLQLIMPGEVAPPHRHTQTALRFVIEGRGAYTAVNGQKAAMEPGDFVITPSWMWHRHGNDSDAPMVWLDGLDIPMAAHFGATFREDRPAPGDEAAEKPPVFSYPWARTRETLQRMAREGDPDPHLGHLMRYLNPLDGGWAMPTMATMARLLPAGFASRPYRSSDGMVLVVVEGSGHIAVDGQRFDLAQRDICVVPNWKPYTLHATEELVLFSFSDRAAQEKLGLFREQRL